MRPAPHWRTALVLAWCAFVLAACNREPKTNNALPAQAKAPGRLPNEIPADAMNAVMAAHLKGLGAMEQFQYGDAVAAFREVHRLAPGWIPGSINLAIALLNDSGIKAQQAKEKGGPPPPSNFDEALALLDAVLERDPMNLHAHYCRGIILKDQGPEGMVKAHDEFAVVAKKDPSDANAWLNLGLTMTGKGPGETVRPLGREEAPKLIEIYTRAVTCNPYLVQALYKLQSAYGMTGDRERQRMFLELWMKLNSERQGNVAAPGDQARTVYSEMGKYATVIDPTRERVAPAGTTRPPRFEPPAALRVALPEGHRWAKESDFNGRLAVHGRARARFGAGVAAFDANGDHRLDLYITGAVHGPDGVRDALLLNRGDGRFEDATLALGLPKDRVSLGVAAGDFDADRHIDLFLAGFGDNRLFRNRGENGFEDVTEAAGVAGTPAVTLTARWLDLDQDGDLDLYVVNHTSLDHADQAFTDTAPPGLANAAFRNDGKPAPVAQGSVDSFAPVAVAWAKVPEKGLSLALTPWPDAVALAAGTTPHSAVAALDLDDDRDLDLVIFSDGTEPRAALNDRLGRFHTAALPALATKTPVSGLLVTDLDLDGRTDLVTVGPKGGVAAWRNATQGGQSGTEFGFEAFPNNARGWRSALLADLDLDGRLDLVGLPALAGKDSAEGTAPAWARHEGDRLATQTLALGPDLRPLQGLALVDLSDDALPDFVLVRDGEGPAWARNRGNGHHWLALELHGRWRAGKKDLMRTNPHGLGTRLRVEGQGLYIAYDHTTPEAGVAQSVAPVVLGLGDREKADLLRIAWPDAAIQSELNLNADRRLVLAEENRKPDSCPVLFTWDGRRFVCVGDFLGGGGLGYLIAPGVANEPDRDEAVAIAGDQLRPREGMLHLSVTEPMNEVTYLDHLVLDVVDRPPGISAAPDERFAPDPGSRPSGQLLAWKTAIAPVRATDLEGRDVTPTLRDRDRRTADGFGRLEPWTGYAEEHGIILDFGDRLSRFGPDDRLFLCLAGWVEYPHSMTNYAAATAGVALKPPVLERRREDGTWEVLDPHPGYPAGLPRLSTLELTGKLAGPRCVLRLRTNMECYWDQAFVAHVEPRLGVRVTPLGVARAELGERGYFREVSPDGRLPLLYDYDHVDSAPLSGPAGMLTRCGDVTPLLRTDDDHLCVIGPGDEVRIAFDGHGLPDLPEGWTRSYVLRSIGYCKDTDLGTVGGDTVEPLPWRAMPSAASGQARPRPEDAAYRAYLREYQTRPFRGR